MTWNWEAAATFVSAIGVLLSSWVAFKLHGENLRHNRRQQLFPIWKEMLELSRIDPQNPNNEEVRIALNLLQLITQCYEKQIVEPKLLREMFSRVYVDVYKDIDAINTPVTIGTSTKRGRDFITDIPPLTVLYNRWSVDS